MKRGLWYIAILVGVYLLLRNVVGIQSTGSVASASNSLESSSSTHQVIYKATTDRLNISCFGVDATYEMPSGTAQKHTSVCDGSKSLVIDQRIGSRGDFVYLSVQNDEQFAVIGCEIYIDGKLVFQTHSQGQYVIASCSGSID